MLAGGGEEVLTTMNLRQEHWTLVWSTDALERLSKEVKGRISYSCLGTVHSHH